MIGCASAEETAEQRNEGGADQGDTATGHELLDTLGLRAGVIVAVALKQVDDDLDTETGTDSNHQSLKDRYRRREKSHIHTSVS